MNSISWEQITTWAIATGLQDEFGVSEFAYTDRIIEFAKLVHTAALDKIDAGYEARIEQLLGILWECASKLESQVVRNPELPKSYATVVGEAFAILTIPADRSALDAYLAPYKLDAERYRWLRDKCRIQEVIDFECGTESETLKDMDQAIDSMIAAAKEK